MATQSIVTKKKFLENLLRLILGKFTKFHRPSITTSGATEKNLTGGLNQPPSQVHIGLSDRKKAKTMLNDWESALTGHTLKVLFGNKLKEEICGSSKRKTKSKDVFKCISSSKGPFCEDSLSSCGDKGRGNR